MPNNGIDVFRGTAGVVELPPEVSTEIWTEVQRNSVIQQLCRRITVPGSGLVIPIITGDPEAEWVSETEEKPVSRPQFGTKVLKPYTMAVIEPFSRQFVRDLPALYNECRTRLPLALAKKFDRTCLGYLPSPGTGFDTLEDAPEVSIAGEDQYHSVLAALSAVVDAEDGADITGWAVSGQAEVLLLGALDNNGRPLFITNVTTEGSIGSVLARPAYKNSNVRSPDGHAVGFGGDWNTAVWGYVEAINISVSTEATLNDNGTPLNLWQRNMVAIRAEFEIGFAVRDENRFVRLTNGGNGGGGGG